MADLCILVVHHLHQALDGLVTLDRIVLVGLVQLFKITQPLLIFLQQNGYLILVNNLALSTYFALAYKN